MKKNWKFRMSFINVGNGDAILLEMKDKSLQNDSFVMLIDGGSGEAWEYENNDTGRLRAAEFLKQQNIDHIDVLVNTHIHEDHTCGLLDVMKQNMPRVFWQPFDRKLWKQMKPLTIPDGMGESERKFTAALNAYHSICEKVEEQGGKIAGKDSDIPSELKIRILGPSTQLLQEQEQRIKCLYQQIKPNKTLDDRSIKRIKELDAAMNDVSLVLLVEYEGHTFLLPGDTQITGYYRCNEELHAEIFKVGHHGQVNALEPKLLYAVSPKYAIISASSDRRYESAAPGILQMLHDFGTKMYFTDVPKVPPYTEGLIPHEGVAFEIMQDGSMFVRYLI